MQLAITDFYVVFVENLVVPVIFRKMFIDEVQKLSADVCLNVHAVGRVEPNYVCLLYTSPSPRDGLLSRMPSSA